MKVCKTLKSALLITAATLGATTASAMMDRPAYAQEAVRTYNIAAQDLDGALREFAMQTGRDVLYSPGIVAGRSSRGARGRFTERQALSGILAGTGLTVQVTASHGYAIVDPDAAQGDGRPGQASRSDLGAEPALLPEVLVQGSGSLNTDVRRSEDDVLPYVVFDRYEIQQSQAANVEDFLRSRLSMASDRGTISRNDPANNASGNRSSINLRGLGANQTLILINGRRAPGVVPERGANLTQPDVNGIPIASIERIEILPGTASGIYGGGATGGVINIILRKDYSGTELQLTYDNTFDTDSARRRVDLSTGFSLEGGRTQVMASGSYSDGNDLLSMDRNFIGRARDLAFDNAPNWFIRNASLGSNRTNFVSSSGGNLTLRDGTPYGASFGSVPVGYAGGDGGAGLLAGAGTLDLTLPEGRTGQRQSLSAVPENQAINLTIRRDMTDAIQAYLDLSATKSTSVTRQTFPATQFRLAGGQGANPFQQAVTVTIPDPSLDTDTETESSTQRINGGVIIELPHGWTAGVDANWNRATNAYDADYLSVDPFAVRAAVTAGQIDLFRDLDQFPIDFSPYLAPQTLQLPTAPTYMEEYTARVAGPLFSLPAGQVRMTGLVSYRVDEDPGYLSYYAPFQEHTYFHPRSQAANSVYVETVVPLFSEAQDVFLLHSLEAQLSARWDRYVTKTSPAVYYYGDDPQPAPDEATNTLESTDYTVGVKYMPFSDLSIRASYATGFLPPNLTQLLGYTFDFFMVYADPLRGDTISFTDMVLTAGGNADLKPEQSTSQSIGLIYTPSFVRGLRVSVDFVNIEKTDEIASIDGDLILQNEALFPGRVIRGGNLPGDPVGWAGPVTSLDTSMVNASRSRLEATDIQVDYERDFGDLGWFRFYAVGTVQSTMERQLLTTLPMTDRVGFSDGPGRLRFNAGVDWQRGPWSLALNTQFYDEYKVFESVWAATTQALQAEIQGSSTIPSQTYTDISGRYVFESGWLAGSQISVGVRNLFNQEPPLLATGSLSGGYSTFADPRLRTYSVSIRRSF